MSESFPEKPAALWRYFKDLTCIPRPSQKEDQVIEYLIKYAEQRGLTYKSDTYGNISILVPGKRSSNDAKRVILQGHVDMVCDARPGRRINFETDPIETIRDGDILKAVDTTLGADNGIGVAASLAVFDELETYPPLNLLFTVDEERGLHGASNLEVELLEGDVLLNLDGEDFGQFFIGCAGGSHATTSKRFETEELNAPLFKLSVMNLKGGHSGCDIHLKRRSANQLIFELLGPELIKEIQINEIQSGKSHNIIARDGWLSFAVIGDEESFISKLNDRIESIDRTLGDDDENVEIELEKFDPQELEVLSVTDGESIYQLSQLHPHGALEIDWSFASPVTALSANFAKVVLKQGQMITLCSYRFNQFESRQSLKEKLIALYTRFELDADFTDGYPAWTPNWDSEILKKGTELFHKVYPNFKDYQVTAMHAGLECGVLLSKKPELDALSFGPDIRNAHSPDEYVSVSSVEKFWCYFSKLLEELA